MGEFFNKIKGEFQQFWSKLTIGQKSIIISLSAALLISFLFFMTWLGKTDYTVLYSNLTIEDASSITDKLKELKINYKLQNNGSIVLVPNENVYDLRMQLASEGIPKKSGIGFEIFDSAKLGMSERIQEINYQRALSGELARTIQGIEGVEGANVHLVIPKRSLFEEDQEKTSASIYLKLTRKNSLKPQQVLGITHLIASSVEGLEPENITIVDNFGNILNEVRTNDFSPNINASQMEWQQKIEEYNRIKVEKLLENIIGNNKAKVSVNVEVDYDKMEQTKEIFDPNTQVARSEENIEENSEVTGDAKTHTITNYEVSKTVEHIVKAVGVIKKMSIAVLIDGRYKVVNGQKAYEERAPEELTKIEDLVKKSIGYDQVRGDQVSIQNMQFDRSDYIAEMEAIKTAQRQDMISAIAKWVIIVIIVLLALYVIYRSISTISGTIQQEMEALRPKPSEDEMAALSRSEELQKMGYKKEMTIDEKKIDLIIEELKENANKNPKEFAKLIRSWMINETLR